MLELSRGGPHGYSVTQSWGSSENIGLIVLSGREAILEFLFFGLALAVASFGEAHAQAPEISSAPSPLIVLEKDAPTIPVALWTENGKPQIARGADDVAKAPTTATKIRTKFYRLGDLTIRRPVFPVGAKFSPLGGSMDTLVYILSGRMKVTMGEVAGEVGPGDTFREIAGQQTVFEVLEDVVALEINVPPSPKP